MIKRCGSLILAFAGLMFGSLLHAASERDSLQALINRETNDSVKSLLYNKMAKQFIANSSDEYMKKTEFDTAYAYADSGLMLAQDMMYAVAEIELVRTIGSLHYYVREDDQAVHYFKQSFDLANQNGTTTQNANAMYNMGLAYMYLKQYRSALECLNLVQELIRDEETTQWTYDINSSMALIYGRLHEDAKALDMGTKALSAARQLDSMSVARVQSQLGMYWLAVGDTVRAMAAYMAAQRFFQESGQPVDDAQMIYDYIHEAKLNTNVPNLLKYTAATAEAERCYSLAAVTNRALSEIYAEAGKPDSANYFSAKALALILKSDVPASIAEIYLWLGAKAMKKEQWDDAEDYSLEALHYADILGSAILQVEILDQLTLVYNHLNSPKLMLRSAKASSDLLDSLQQVENKRRMEVLQLHYTIREQREQHELELKTQREQQREALSSSLRNLVIASIGLLVLLVLLAYLVRNYLKVKFSNSKMRHNQAEMLALQKNLNKSNLELDMYKDYLEEMVEKKAAEQMQRDLQLFGLASNLPGGFIYRKIVAADGSERLSYISDNVEKLFGVTAEQLIQQGNFDLLWSEEAVVGLRETELESARTMDAYRYEFRTTRNGKPLWLMLSCVPQSDEATGNVIWDGFVIDITKQKQEEERLQTAKERAEESDRQKSLFLSNMSHEIRTPMNAIMGFISFVEREDITPEKRRFYITTIRNSVNQLLKLIENIIDISKLEINQLTIHPVEFAINTLMREIEAEFIPQTESKPLFFQLDDSEFLPDTTILVNDRLRIAQILRKLLDNAFKYTEKGYIRFGYRRRVVDDELLFFVEDTGIGISPHQQDAIFEYFRQSDDIALKPKYGGTGLGLSISKGLVEVMHGRIWLESTPGEGTSVYFTIKKKIDG